MAFLGSIGKFFGGAIKSVGRAVGPALGGALQGLTTAGPKGAIAGLGAGFVSGLVGGRGGPPAISPGPGIFSGFQTTLAGPVFQQPRMMQQQFPAQAGPIVVADTQLQLTKPIFDSIIKLAERLNIPIRRASAVMRIGRSILSRLIRFSRATPGLTIVSMLVSLGLSLFEANELITWFSTSGKKHRRLKVTNVKALNRSVRRLEGFRRLSRRVEMALAGRGGSRSRSIARRRCPRCRKNPCCC